MVLGLDPSGATLNTDFDAAPVLQTFADAFAKKLRKRFNVTVLPAEAAAAQANGAPITYVQVVQIDQGNRWLRYFLGIFAGAVVFEVQGYTQGPAGRGPNFSAVGQFGCHRSAYSQTCVLLRR